MKPRTPNPYHTSGFTLVEMAVVLVVIALIAGAIVGGRTLIRNAQLREALVEYDSHLSAIQEFQDKYMGLPGDISNATTMWGTDPSGCPNLVYSATKRKETCNGDANGRIGASTTGGVLSSQTEWWRAWQQLSNAGFVNGMYTGVRGSGSVAEAAVGGNVAASKVSGAGWTLLYYLNTAGNVGLWSDSYGHIMAFGGYSASNITRGAVLTPDDAVGIDRKIDDGKPGSGKVRAWRTSVLANCTTTDTSQTNQAYNIAYTGGYACSLVFVPGF